MKKLLLLATLLLPSLLAAQPIDFTQQIKDLAGKPIVTEVGKPPLTLGDVCINALETMIDSDRGMSGQEKFKLDQLARKIYNQKHVELSVEEIVLIKDRVGKVSPPIAVGAAWIMLDPPEKKAEK